MGISIHTAVAELRQPLSERDPVILDGKVSWDAVRRRKSAADFTETEGLAVIRDIHLIENQVEDFLATEEGRAGLALLTLTSNFIILDQRVFQSDVGTWGILAETCLSGHGFCKIDVSGFNPISVREAVRIALHGKKVQAISRSGFNMTGGMPKTTIPNLYGLVDYLKEELAKLAASVT